MAADKQLLAKRLFQQSHLLADRRLRDQQFLRGIGETQMPGRGGKCPQPVQRRRDGLGVLGLLVHGLNLAIPFRRIMA